jgi:hypothetical protein
MYYLCSNSSSRKVRISNARYFLLTPSWSSISSSYIQFANWLHYLPFVKATLIIRRIPGRKVHNKIIQAKQKEINIQATVGQIITACFIRFHLHSSILLQAHYDYACFYFYSTFLRPGLVSDKGKFPFNKHSVSKTSNYILIIHCWNKEPR